ncbi:hypothetical protein B0H11DRAFT_1922038 [Mycena galericulata]|nr:hypothetical protein B0H11DRAFT_1922038 [Mycena galericulata]
MSWESIALGEAKRTSFLAQPEGNQPGGSTKTTSFKFLLISPLERLYRGMDRMHTSGEILKEICKIQGMRLSVLPVNIGNISVPETAGEAIKFRGPIYEQFLEDERTFLIWAEEQLDRQQSGSAENTVGLRKLFAPPETGSRLLHARPRNARNRDSDEIWDVDPVELKRASDVAQQGDSDDSLPISPEMLTAREWQRRR